MSARIFIYSEKSLFPRYKDGMQVKEKVFVLRKIRHGDADLILNCLTANGAKISFFARSALKSRKRFGGGVLEPTHYILALYEHKGRNLADNRLFTLKEATLINGFEKLRSDYGRIEAGLYFVGLVGDVVREGDLDSAEIFNLLGNTLRAAEASSNLESLKIHFAAKLLESQGILPLEEEEALLLKTPIAAHEEISLSDAQWAQVRGRLRRVMSEYTGRQPRSERTALSETV